MFAHASVRNGGYLCVYTRTATSPPARPSPMAKANAPTSSIPSAGYSVGMTTPPIGTIVLGHEQVIYVGNGEWQPLDDRPNH